MDSLSPDNNIPRQGTFETEPADTVHGRSIKRGNINLPYIDDQAVKNGHRETKIVKDKDDIKKEQLRGLKEQRERDRKEKELRDLKEKKEKELKAQKEKLLKANNAKDFKESSSKVQKDVEIKADKEKELKLLKDRQLKAQKERDTKVDKEKELKLLKDRQLKAQKDRDTKVDKEKELKLTKERELKAQKQKELQIQKDKEQTASNEKNLKAIREAELKSKREQQLKANNEKEKKIQQTKEKESKEKDLKTKDVETRSRKQQKPKGSNGDKKQIDEKPGFFQRLGRSLSPAKKQVPPAATSEPQKEFKSNANLGKGDKPIPTVLVIDNDRFAEVRVPTPAHTSDTRDEEEKTHFKAVPPRQKDDDDDTSRANPESTSNDSITLSATMSDDTYSQDAEKHGKQIFSKGAWTSDQPVKPVANNTQKTNVLRKFNNNSPRTSVPDEESTLESSASKKAPLARSSPANHISRKLIQDSNQKSREDKIRDDDNSSLSSTFSGNQEPYDHVLAERDCLLTAEVAYKRRIKQLEEETNQLAEALDKRDNEIKELKWNIENPSSVSEVTNLTKTLQEQIEKLQLEIDELQKEKRKYKILHNDSERKVNEFEDENDKLKEKMLMYEQGKLPLIEELQQDNKKLEASQKQVKAKFKETEEQFEVLKNENKTLSDEVGSRRNEVQELLLNLKNQKTAELEIQKANTRLEERLKNLSNLEKELAVSAAKTAIVEAEKEHAESLIKEKEREIKEMKDLVEAKDSDIENQKLAVELQKEEIDNLRKDLDDQQKDIAKTPALEQEKEGLKETLKSLKLELDNSNTENKSLKEHIVELLERTQTATGSDEGLQTIKGKLEAEKTKNVNLEEEIVNSKEEISRLQQQNMQINIKVVNLNERLKSKKETNPKGVNNVSKKDFNSDDKLAEENKRLKLRLVEKNFEELSGNEEKKGLSSRLEHLERKQVDNDVKVRQLQGWVDDIYSEPPANILSQATVSPGRLPKNVIPRVAVAAQSDKSPLFRNKSMKVRKPRDVSPRPQQGKNSRVTVSLGDTDALSRSSTPSLPIINDIPEQAPLYNSYFYIYKQKQKLMRQQEKIR